MKKYILPFLLLLAIIVGVVAAFGTGGADESAEPVVLGEEDLMEQVEIWRNQYRRMTPGDGPLVQDVGALPAAWEEFGNRWSSAPAERNLATWLVPFSAERQGDTTVIRDADGAVLWSGTTDFAMPGSTNVTITGALVDETDWPLYDASRWEVLRRMSESQPRLRDGEGGGTDSNSTNNPSNMFVSAYGVFTNDVPEFHVGLQWTNDVTLDIFAFGSLHEAVTNEVTYTNDENQVITTNVVSWHSVEPGLTGRYDNLWEHVGTVSLTNGDEAVFIDTNYVPERWVVRFYSAFGQGDADNDGLNDAFETRVLGTSTNSADSDNDGLSEWNEYYLHRTNPNDEDTDHDGILDPTELDMGLDPTNADTDWDLIIDGYELLCGTTPATSNVWWPLKTSTNFYYQYYIDDLPTWQDYATNDAAWSWTFSTTSPWPGSIVKDVTLSGFVDDAIKVDAHEVDAAWKCGTTNLDHVSVTNQIDNLQSGQFDLSLWDWPDEGHSGPNEVRIGWSNTDPFIAEWTWWKAFDVQMEPIWTTQGATSLYNPSGIALESNAWFRVDVWPDYLVPATNIVWTSIYHKVEVLHPRTGTLVQVHALEEGDDELLVTVEGAQGNLDLPPFHVQVKPLMLVTTVVGVVQLVDGPTAVEASRVTNDIRSANQILAQAAIQIVWDGTIQSIPATDDNGYWEVVNKSPQFTNLCSELSCSGGLEIYYVHDLDGMSGADAAGVATSNGIVIAASATNRTFPHEIGHVCGAKDIYVKSPYGNTQLTGVATSDSVPHDWGNYMTDYEWGIQQSNLVKRLLMYGVSTPMKGDIPSREVYGLRKYPFGDGYTYHPEMCPVGLSAMTNMPPVSY